MPKMHENTFGGWAASKFTTIGVNLFTKLFQIFVIIDAFLTRESNAHDPRHLINSVNLLLVLLQSEKFLLNMFSEVVKITILIVPM